MAKRWNYSHAEICRVGTMICTACRQKINDGMFRYRETDDAYLPQHKACCADDPEWAHIETRRQKQEAYFVRRKDALQAFINEYGAPDDELIDECMAARPHSSTDGAPK